MLRQLLLAAVTAGLAAGATVSLVQQVTTVPLILQAEQYESPAPAAPAAGHAGDHAHAAPAGPDGPDAERVVLTVATNLIVGTGYALLLSAAMLVAGTVAGARFDARRGLLWGAGGFVAFTLAPAFGLPPELPGTVGAELAARQAWWLAAAGTAAGGLLLASFVRRPWAVPAAVVLAALPHIVGAPHPEMLEGLAPSGLAAQYAAVSIGVGAVFWATLGAVCGAMMRRLSPAT